MSFQDSAVIFFIALLLFGPKKLPELARQIGKLMGEFRRASNDFRMQMEDELRIAEQAERQKQIAAIEAAAPPSAMELAATPAQELEAHPHAHLSGPPPEPFPDAQASSAANPSTAPIPEHTIAPETAPEPPDRTRGSDDRAPAQPVPIARSGDLSMMPPSTGLPIARSTASVTEAFDSVPRASASPVAEPEANSEAAHHG